MIPRVSNNSVYNNVLKNIQKQLIEQDRLFEQISSNKKNSKPSDNPIGTSESMTIRKYHPTKKIQKPSDNPIGTSESMMRFLEIQNIKTQLIQVRFGLILHQPL